MKIETNTGCALTWLVAAAAITMSLAIAPGCAQQRIDTGKMYEVPSVIGPYNAEVLPDGDGLTKDLDPNEAGLHATNPWTFFGWVRPSDGIDRTTLIAGLGDPGEEYSRFLASDHGHLMLWLGDHAILANPSPDLSLNTWQFVAASYDGSRFHLYENGEEVASGAHNTGDVSALLQLGPRVHLRKLSIRHNRCEASDGALRWEHLAELRLEGPQRRRTAPTVRPAARLFIY